MKDYDLQKMQQLLRDFYNLTNIKICIYDNAENELCFYPEKLSSFCSLLRTDEQMANCCLACDQQAFSECKKSREQYVYTCHAGLLECISPILFDDKIIGYIVLGQIKSHERSDFSYIENNVPPHLRTELAARFENLPTIDTDKIGSALRILDACTGYEYLKRLVQTGQNRIDTLLDEYINKHLSDDLSVATLCSRFHLSHNEIYSIFREYFHSTPAEYVKLRRLQKACELLRVSSLSINQIAKACGIPDYNYFSKVFKRAFNISPTGFRKQPILPI